MALLFFALISWLLICIFSVMPKRYTLVENTVVFMALDMAYTSMATIFELNLGYVQLNMRQALFLCNLLERSLDIPLLLLAGINQISACRKTLLKAGAFCCTLVAASFVEWLALAFGVKVYMHWNGLLELFTFASLLALGWLLAVRVQRYERGRET